MTGLKNGFKKQKVYYGFGAVLITCFFFLIALKISHIYPFGDKTLIYHDMQYQYMDYLTWLRNVLHGIGNIGYSFTIGMGEGTAAFFAYYLASPLNVLLALFPQDKIVLGITVLIMLKLGLSAGTMFLYLDKRFDIPGLFLLLLSLSYSMMGYNVLNYSNIMWLDGVIILPLIALGIHNLIYKKEKVLYFCALWYGVITSWYIGYMLCLFAVIYFVIELILCNMANKQERKIIIQCFIEFSIVSVLACFSTLVLLLPQTMQMLAQGESDFLVGMNANFNCSFLEGFKDLFLNGVQLTKQQTNPPIYVGSFPLLCIASWILNKKESVSKKYLVLIVLGLGILAFIFNPINYTFSMFKVPTNHYYRHAFLFSFLLIAFAGMAVQSGIKSYGVLAVLAVGVLFDSLLQYEERTVLYFGLLSTAVLGILLLLYNRCNHEKKRLLSILLICFMLIAIGAEHIKDWQLELADHEYSYEKISSYNKEMKTIVDKIEEMDSSVYRMDKTTARFADCYNVVNNQSESMAFDYSTLSHYSSTRNVALADFMVKMGYSGVTKLTVYNPMPMMDALLGVKYIIGNELPSDYQIMDDIYSDNVSVFQNPYDAGMAYAIKEDMPGIVSLPQDSVPFDNQSAFMSAISGRVDNYYQYHEVIPIATDNASYYEWQINVVQDGPLYIYVKNGGPDLQFYINEQWVFCNYWYSNSVRYIGEYRSGDVVKVKVTNGSNVEQYGLYATTLNREAVNSAFDVIKENAITITDWKDGQIKAHASFEKERQILFTIPYEKGWVIKVNGQRVDYSDYAGAFISIMVPAGESDIAMQFVAPGLIAGTVLSLFGVLGFVGYLIISRKNIIVKKI